MDKKGQLFALELKELSIGFVVGFVVALVGFGVLAKLGYIDFILDFLCNCGQ